MSENEKTQDISQDLRTLYLHIIRTVDLPEFAELLCEDLRFKWRREGISAVCNCPMSWHNDRNASFHINKMDDGVFLFQCFGCHCAGNVVNFYMNYMGEEDRTMAIKNICKRLNITLSNAELQLEAFQHVTNRIDRKKEMESANILVSNQCRLLLRKNFDKYKIWVSSAYKRLNYALDNENSEEIEKIGYEASAKIVE